MTVSTGKVPGRIFMSYRREDTDYPAAWLYERLAGHFSGDQVFKDVDSIELGDDFVEVITAAVGSCEVLLALIGDRWLTATSRDGRRRLEDPADFVRLEIEAALARNVRVIPVLVEGARMPRADELPESLSKLTRRQALELSPSRFDLDTRRLLTVLERTITRREDEDAAQAGLPPARKLVEHQTVPASRREAPATPAPETEQAAHVPAVDRSDVRDSSTGPTGADEPEMILVPGGEFYTGLTEAQLAEINRPELQLPRGSMLDVPAFQIAKFPVTNGDYARFVVATGRFPPRHWDGSEPPGRLRNHPVVWVSWAAANAYCEWLRAEVGLPFRLPTSFEWEKAARGVDGRKFPWGNDFDRSRCHFKARSTVPVTTHAPAGDSIFGVSDMVGNAREWTSTEANDYGKGTELVVRGGGFLSGTERGLWCGFRDVITGGPKASIGFRVALS
jgi:formylglycine-generating enzyme required for sulfatase activity